jgi:hypothetical protein
MTTPDSTVPSDTDRLADIRARLDAATPAPWKASVVDCSYECYSKHDEYAVRTEPPELASIRERTEADFVTDPASVCGELAAELIQARLDRRVLLANFDAELAEYAKPAPEMPRPAAESNGDALAAPERGTGVREAHEGAQAVDTIARILVGSDWDEGVRITDIGSRETVARMAEQIVAALWPDVDGWTIHAGLDGDVSIGHHTSGALLTGKDIPVGAVLAFIADQPLTERTTT